MKKIYTLLTLFIMVLCYNANAQNIYVPITIDNSGAALTDYQVKLTINSAALITAGKMQLNCADIRLRSVNGQELDHWVESGCNTTMTTVWVNVPSLPTGQTVVYLMYGNPDASTASNIDNTMDQGLRVSYYSGEFGTLLGTCTEANAPNYDWASGMVSLSTCPNNLDENVSLRWEGWIVNKGTGNHTFYYNTDDRSRLYLNNTLVMEQWFDQGPTEYSGNYSFSAPVTFKYEFYENGGGAVAQVGWEPADGSGKTYPISGSNLRYNKISSVEPTYTTASEVAVVHIPDANFKTELLANAAINTNGNGEIEVTEATTYTGAINVQNQNIADLTGIQAFPAITALNVSDNELITLNLTSNTALTSFNCDNNNDLIVLNIKNGTNTLITSFTAINNPDLYCIQVDNQAFSVTNWTSIDAQTNFNGNCLTNDPTWCFVTIPDANFKAFLLGNASINLNADAAIQCSEAATYTGSINVSSSDISDLTGIEAFTALTELNCSSNELTSLDLSANTALTSVDCRENQLTSLDVTANTALDYLHCNDNQLTDLTINTSLIELYCNTNQLTSLNLSSYTALTFVECQYNQLTNLNLAGCTALTDLNCYDNQITNLNLTGCTVLNYLECENNQLTSLNVSTCTALTDLYCYNNQLTSLNLSSNTALTFIDCGVNQLTNLNVSTCTALTDLFCYNNQLTSLDIKNGNNINFSGFSTSNNPNLSCIQVDDATYMNTNWSGAKDANANYNTDCSSACTVNIPDNSFRAVLLADAGINTNADAFIQCSEAATYTGNMSVNGNGISDLTGIEAFTALTYLECTYNNLTSLDLSTNPALTYLDCWGNQLTTLTVSGNTALIELYCGENQLTDLDVSANTALTDLSCGYNQLTNLTLTNSIVQLYCQNNELTSLNLSSYTALTFVECQYNQLTNLNLVGSTALEQLYCYDNQLTNLNVSSYTALYIVDCSDNELTNLNFTGCSSLQELYCNYNQLTTLNVSSLTTFEYLECYTNELTSLNVSGCTALYYLDCGENQLTTIDVSSNTALEELYCYSNKLITFNMSNGNNVNLNDFDVLNNPNLSCIKVDDATFMDTNWSGSKDAGATYSVDCSSFCTVNIPDDNFRNALLADAGININADAFIQCTEASTYTGSIDVGNQNISDMTGIEAFVVLTELHCYGNQLTSLDVATNTALTRLSCNNNQLTSLTVSSNTALTYLDCSGNQITSLNISANTALDHFECYYNQLTSIDVSSNTALTYFDCWGNQISSLNVSTHTGLIEFYCGENLLTSLNVSASTALEYFYCDDNAITSLNVSANTNLKDLSCPNNALTSLDMKNGNNVNLTDFDVTNNPNLSCIQVDDVTYMNTNWASAKDATANYSGNCCIIPITNVQSLTICAGQSLVVGTSTYTTSNTYTDVLTSFNGCDSTVTTHLTVKPVIDVTTIVNGADITANQAGATYQWIDCGNANTAIAGATGQSYTATASGSYAVIITLNSCSKTSACSDVSVGISEVSSLANQISVYPNPFNKEASIIIPNGWITANSKTTLTITDISGKQVANYSVKNEKITIKRENLETGLYFVKVQNEKQSLTQKIVITD